MDESSINPYAPPLTSSDSEADGYVPGPKRHWPRYLARRIDQGLLVLPVGFLWGLLLVLVIGPARIRKVPALLHGVAALGLTTFLEAALLCTWGSTPGKWLYAIRLRTPEGARIGYLRALKRSAIVYLRGVGLGIPVANVVTAIMGYNSLDRDGATPWDPADLQRVEHGPMATWRWVLAVLVTTAILILDVVASIRWLS